MKSDKTPAKLDLPKCVVILRVYDLSKGHAARVSQILMTRPIAGIWHTALEVYGFEYFYGGNIGKAKPEEVEESLRMKPAYTRKLGRTTKTMSEFDSFLCAMYEDFTPQNYHLVTHNCNNFSDIAAKYLLDGKGIPQQILNLPQQIKSSMVGRLVLSILDRVREPGGVNPVVLKREGRRLKRETIEFDCRSQRSDRAVHNGSCTREKSRHRRDCLSLPPRESVGVSTVEQRVHRRQHTIAMPLITEREFGAEKKDGFVNARQLLVRQRLTRSTMPLDSRASLMSTTDGMVAPPFVLSSRGTTAKFVCQEDALWPQPTRPLTSPVAVARRLLLSRTPTPWRPNTPVKSPLAPRDQMIVGRTRQPRVDDTFWLITHADAKDTTAVFPASFRATTRAS